jgi:RNA polymerase sigma-70 factor (ECF subfamily)
MDGELGVSSLSAPDLEQLMVRYQKGDAAAAKSLVDLLGARLYVFFASQMGDRADAEDMLQEAWLRIHRVRRTYRPGEPVLPWVYAIARRVRVDGYRRRRRIARRELPVDVLPAVRAAPSVQAGPPPFAEIVASLPESQREALTMLKVDGLSIEEVARATSSTEGAVKQRVHRAYETLRALLRTTLGTPREGERR